MWRNTRERWGRISIGLHWLIAGLVLLVQVPAGIGMVSVGRGALQDALYNTHKTTGLVIFILACLRLLWRLAFPAPALPADIGGWQRLAANLSHVTLYLLIFLLPISGFLYTAQGGFPVPFFMTWELSHLVPRDQRMAEFWKAVHLNAQLVLYAVVVIHVAAAFHHHRVRRDGTLRRMLSSRAPLPEGDR